MADSGGSYTLGYCTSYKVFIQRCDVYQLYAATGDSLLEKNDIIEYQYSENYLNPALKIENNLPKTTYTDGKIYSDLFWREILLLMKTKTIFLYVGILCLLVSGIFFYKTMFQEMPLIQSKDNCFLGAIAVYEKHGPISILDQLNEEEKNEILSLLSECNIKRTFEKTIGKTENGMIYSIILHEDEPSFNMYYVGITDDINYCSKDGEKYYILKYEGDLNRKLQSILENRIKL